MKTRIRFLNIFMAIVVCVIFAGCGGGGGSSPSTGRFVDGPVVGLGYSSGTHSGITVADGSFTYENGNSVKFFIGDIALGEATPKGSFVVTPLQLVPGSDVTTPQVVNIVRFLLSIGSVDSAGTITIPSTVPAAAKGKTINFATATDAELADLVKAVTQNAGAALTDQNTAMEHLSNCISAEFRGIYSGSMTYSDGKLAWMVDVTINPDGTFSGKILENNETHETLVGKMESGTKFNVVASGGCPFAGRLDTATGIISGTWSGPEGRTNLGGKFSFSRTKK